MIQEEIEQLIKSALEKLRKKWGDFAIERISLHHPENPEHGDYATAVAFALAKQIKRIPQEIAEAIKSEVQRTKSKTVERVEAVGGFVNFYLHHDVLLDTLSKIARQKSKFGKNNFLKGKKIMVEYAHPNTHKEMHIGHMRTLITGESLARLFEVCGAKVFRANYQGDIGPHVAKAIWGTEKILQERKMSWSGAEKLSLPEKAHLLGQGYVKGNQEYEQHKQEIDELNAKLYEHSKAVSDVYERTRKWSLDYYDSFYKRFDTKFDKLYFESQVASLGKKIVQEDIGRVFEQSDGAIVFKGEQYGLHTRVFITQDGNPTYEGKEMGLAPLQYKDFPFDLNIHVVANEQAEYFRVVFKALELVNPKFKGKQYHLSMGMVQLVGKKMSSRRGEIITVDGLLQKVQELLAELVTSQELTPKEKEVVKEKGTIAAVKYSVLKTDTRSNVLFDMERSVTLDGDSGPYLLYTYARCKSIVRKAGISKSQIPNPKQIQSSTLRLRSGQEFKSQKLSKEELDVLRTFYKFPEVVQEAAAKYAPNIVCNFAFDLAQKYNAFYNKHRVLDAETKDQKQFRLLLTVATAQLLKNSLQLLGIQPLDRM